MNVEEVFFSIGRDIKKRLSEKDSKPEVRLSVFHVGEFIRAGLTKLRK